MMSADKEVNDCCEQQLQDSIIMNITEQPQSTQSDDENCPCNPPSEDCLEQCVAQSDTCQLPQLSQAHIATQSTEDTLADMAKTNNKSADKPTGKDDADLYCKACDVQCKNQDQFNNHCRTMMHTQQIMKQEDNETEVIDLTESAEKEMEDEEAGEGDEYYCNACEIQCKDQDQFNNHSRTIMHTQKVMLYEETARERKLQERVEARKKENTGTGIPYEVYEASNEFYCEVCMTRMTGAKPYEDHLEGSRHKKNLARIEAGVVPIKRRKQVDKSQMDPEDLHRLRCQDILDSFDEPLIGLQYVKELRNEDPSIEERYLCTLCDMKSDPRTLTTHVIGLKHRMNYFRERYMNYYVLVRQGNRRKAEQTEMALEYAVDIEAEEGRLAPQVIVEANPQYNPDKLKNLSTDVPAGLGVLSRPDKKSRNVSYDGYVEDDYYYEMYHKMHESRSRPEELDSFCKRRRFHDDGYTYEDVEECQRLEALAARRDRYHDDEPRRRHPQAQPRFPPQSRFDPPHLLGPQYAAPRPQMPLLATPHSLGPQHNAPRPLMPQHNAPRPLMPQHGPRSQQLNESPSGGVQGIFQTLTACSVETEEEAKVALQISNSLSRALLNYRRQHKASEEGSESGSRDQDMRARLSQAAGLESGPRGQAGPDRQGIAHPGRSGQRAPGFVATSQGAAGSRSSASVPQSSSFGSGFGRGGPPASRPSAAAARGYEEDPYAAIRSSHAFGESAHAYGEAARAYGEATRDSRRKPQFSEADPYSSARYEGYNEPSYGAARYDYAHGKGKGRESAEATTYPGYNFGGPGRMARDVPQERRNGVDAELEKAASKDEILQLMATGQYDKLKEAVRRRGMAARMKQNRSNYPDMY